MDKEEIYRKVKSIDGLGGMTINERLFATGLMNTFDKAIINDKELARTILEAILVAKPSIEKILK